jgi:hypothetical protein
MNWKDTDKPRGWRLSVFIPALLFALVFVTHSLSPNATSSDSHWIVPQMMRILSAGDTVLNEYPILLRAHSYNALDCVDPTGRVYKPNPESGCPGARYYVWYPIGSAVVALPVLVAMDIALGILGPPILAATGNALPPVVQALLRHDYLACHALVEMLIASFLIAIATVFVFLTARIFLPQWRALLLALLFAFGTAAWSTGSRALWQHGPDMLMLAIVLYLLARSEIKPNLLIWAAPPLTLAYFIRPTAAILVVGFAAYIFVYHRDRFWKWAVLALVSAAPFVLYNLSVYGLPLSPYYTKQPTLPLEFDSIGRFLSAFAGQAVSPSRGLFIFSPFLLFSIAGLWIAIRKRWQAPLVYFLAGMLMLHWIAISLFADWTAGACFGPRYFSDVIPILMFLLIPVFAEFRNLRTAPLSFAMFTLCALLAVAINFRGAASWPVMEWNGDSVNPERAWDWHDPQFLRGLGRAR